MARSGRCGWRTWRTGTARWPRRRSSRSGMPWGWRCRLPGGDRRSQTVMRHDTSLAAAAKADPRPASAVSTGCGVAGLAGLLCWVGLAKWFGMDGTYAALCNVAACGLPMVLWAVLVDMVQLNPSTGIDWANAKPWRETLDICLTKLAGLWLTWAGIAVIYGTGRFY